MLALGFQSKREITRTRIRVRTAMATQTREQGRYLGGRPPYGYRLADAGPHPNKAHAAWGRRAHRLEPDPATAPVVAWMFAQRLAGHSIARITRALNDAGIPCPSAADPKRNPHRSGTAWTLGTVAAILANPRYTGPAGVEPAAHRRRPGRPGQHRAGPPAGAAVEPARRVGHLRPARPSRRWSARPITSPPRRPAPRAARPGRLPAAICWPGCCAAAPAGGGWNRPGPTASPPTGAATATPAPPALARTGRRTSTSARTRSCPAWPPWPSCTRATATPHAAQSAHPRRPRRPPRQPHLIDRLRAAGVSLIYDPATKALRTDTKDAVALSVG